MNNIKKSNVTPKDSGFFTIRTTACLIFLCFILPVNAVTPESTMAEKLGWIPSRIGICKGEYQDPLQAYAKTSLAKINQAFTHIDALQSNFSLEGTSTLSGHVIITQPGRWLQADQVYFYRDAKTGKITNMDLQGKIKLREPNLLISAEKAHLNLTDQSGYLTDIIYRILLRNTTILMGTNDRMPINVWGSASAVE